MSLLTELRGYWSFDNFISSTTTDSANLQTLSAFNGASPGNGIIGTGAKFVSASSQALIRTTAAGDPLDIQSGPISMQAWVKFTSIPTAFIYILSKNNTAGYVDQQYALVADNSTGTMYISVVMYGLNGTVATTSNVWFPATLVTGQFYHIVGTYDGQQSRCYLNSVQLGTLTPSPPGVGFKPNLSIGRRSTAADGSAGNYYLDAVADEIGIWAQNLYPGDVAQLYNGGQGLPYPFGIRRMGRPLFDRGIIMP
jgi:hypothetical protein